MKTLPPLAVPIALALALLAGASAAQDRPNTTLVQKSKAAPTALSKTKAAAPSSAQLSGTSERGAKRTAPGSVQTAPGSSEAQHECHGMGGDA